MHLGKVIGTLVPAVIYEGMEGVPLLWVQPIDKHRQPKGRAFVCADGTRMAGPDEIVYWEASREAALTLSPSFVPVDHAVIGIVDGVQLDSIQLGSVQLGSVQLGSVQLGSVQLDREKP
jgi:ethanolamine utilization protein EutN